MRRGGLNFRSPDPRVNHMKYWLGREDSNLRSSVPKTAALPLCYAPIPTGSKPAASKLLTQAGKPSFVPARFGP